MGITRSGDYREMGGVGSERVAITGIMREQLKQWVTK